MAHPLRREVRTMLFGEPEDNAKLIRSFDAADAVRWIREADDRDHTCRNVELQAALLNAFRLIVDLQDRVAKLEAGKGG
ncbi:hypothetical protein TA3x_005200 [Tundrisphaera sp. TA3]|uniref:hypothetical protein n=1 Tax=Tundrisphaera sp. TA3 TaxID=3435775 RepID=UPI003EB71617